MSDILGEETLRAIEYHQFSSHPLWRYPEWIHALLDVKEAAAFANAKADPTFAKHATRIQSACQSARNLDFQKYYVVDVFQGGGGIGVHQNINEVLTHFSESEEVNRSQSTADVCATALRLSLLRTGKKLESVLKDSAGLFEQRAQVFADTPSTAWTCMRKAAPTTLGVLFEGYAQLLSRRQRHFKKALSNCQYVNLGGAVFGEGPSLGYLEQVKNSLREVTGLELQWRESLYDAAQNKDDLGELSHSLQGLAEALIKINKDLRLLGSEAFGDISIPAVMKGSSFYQDKQNPTLIETVLQAAFLILGMDRSVQASLEHAELHLNVFEMAAGVQLLEGIKQLTRVIRLWNQHMVPHLKGNKTKGELRGSETELGPGLG